MRVPLVILTGFLGAGKTTLLNRLLADRAARNAHGKIGVIVNELGEVGIDGALLGTEAARQIELPGGCVCCVLGDELDKTVIDLVTANPDLEAIVLETTGVAEPLPIAWALAREPVRDYVRLAIVVTLLDATNFRASRGVSVAVAAQVAYADVLLVTKESLAGDADTKATIEAAHVLAPSAQILRGTTEEHVTWLERVLADPDVEHVPTGEPHVHDENCRHPDSHAHGVDSTWLNVEARIDLEELEDQLAALPANYVRIKGIVRTGDGSWSAIHRVGLRVSSEPLDRQPDDIVGENGRLVALGTQLDPEKLAICLGTAYVK
ncbi:MAG TPA: GTP-binding protein [Kofleriaceae bacterium]|nr:GTP-binding protein [Kofleriaceae bacterium]